jgi:hypothetical protein
MVSELERWRKLDGSIHELKIIEWVDHGSVAQIP